MYRVFVVTDRDVEPGTFPWAVDGKRMSYEVGTEQQLEWSSSREQGSRPNAVLLAMEDMGSERARKLVSRCRELGVPVLALVSADHVNSFHPSLNLDDFIIQTFRPEELALRLDHAMFRIRGDQNQNVIRVGDLAIDKDRYEVSLSGKRVVLTYKEYQLLVLLASNPGRVYTRDSLLKDVWGYDYLGGTRTVDVHIRRLRSKIEDASHSFLETIWNVGYRFNAST